MKDLEFRFFLKENKKIYKVSMLSLPLGNQNLKDVCIYIPEEDYYQWFGIEEGNLMMFTGLKDKNGAKIFEGDIIKRKDDILYVIRYIYGGFDSEPINEFYKEPKITWNTLGEMQNALWCMDNCEVIGNIYENKELLEEI